MRHFALASLLFLGVGCSSLGGAPAVEELRSVVTEAATAAVAGYVATGGAGTTVPPTVQAFLASPSGVELIQEVLEGGERTDEEVKMLVAGTLSEMREGDPNSIPFPQYLDGILGTVVAIFLTNYMRDKKYKTKPASTVPA